MNGLLFQMTVASPLWLRLICNAKVDCLGDSIRAPFFQRELIIEFNVHFKAGYRAAMCVKNMSILCQRKRKGAGCMQATDFQMIIVFFPKEFPPRDVDECCY